jgi:DNA-binding NarL/FixJ family response regulator
MITIVLVDDHKMVRDGIKRLLEDEPGLVVVGEAENGADGIQQAAMLQPDVLVTDLMMNGLNGIDVCREVRKISPATRIIILTMYSDPGYVNQSIKGGAQGYVVKGSGIDELITAIRKVTSGEWYLSPILGDGGQAGGDDPPGSVPV